MNSWNKSRSTTIAEDITGMLDLCRPVEEDGFGFYYRLNSNINDNSEENWNMGNIAFTLTNRRYNEKHIGYCESHDKNIVGVKTISMWLFDKVIYWNMAINSQETRILNRGAALHKMIRIISFSIKERRIFMLYREWIWSSRMGWFS